VYKRQVKNKWLLGAVVISIIIAVTIVQTPPLQSYFGTIALEPAEWGILAAISLSILVFEEVRKLILRATKSES